MSNQDVSSRPEDPTATAQPDTNRDRIPRTGFHTAMNSLTATSNARETVDQATSDMIQAMNEREHDQFADVLIRLEKRRGLWVAIVTGTEKRTNVGK